MAVVVTNPTPKARFQESKDNVSRHRDLIQTREFERAADFALLQYSADLQAEPNSLNECAAAHLRYLGAQEFLWCFRNLAESATFSTRKSEVTNLDHKA